MNLAAPLQDHLHAENEIILIAEFEVKLAVELFAVIES